MGHLWARRDSSRLVYTGLAETVIGITGIVGMGWDAGLSENPIPPEILAVCFARSKESSRRQCSRWRAGHMPVGVIPRSWPMVAKLATHVARNVARRRGPNGTVMCLGFTCERTTPCLRARPQERIAGTRKHSDVPWQWRIDQCIGTGSVNVNVM
jgi:hypothetical protein